MKRSLCIRSVLMTGAAIASFSLPVWAQETETEDETLRQQTVVVRGEFIPDEKRSTSEVSSILDAGDFRLQGDSDAAAALSRLAGVATADDKFVYVRGLNERYSSATLNGSPIPSPAPLRRIAPLDLFPTSVLESITVQKTYSPQLSGEFGGGLVAIETNAVPDQRFLEVSAKIGGNTEASFQEGLLYDGGDQDYFGIDDGTRDRPNVVLEDNRIEFGRQLIDDSSLLVLQRGDVGPDFSVDLTAGERIDYNENISIGLLGTVSYSNSWSQREGQRGFSRVTSGDTIEAAAVSEFLSTTNNININAYGAIGFELYEDHEAQFIGFLTRSSDKEGRTSTGFTAESPDQIFRTDTLEWIERQLWVTQASGRSFFPSLGDLEFKWRGSYSEAERDAPYGFDARYEITDFNGNLNPEPVLDLAFESGSIFDFSEVKDETTDLGLDFVLPFTFGGDCNFFCEIDLKAGYSYVENDREALSQAFRIGFDETRGNGTRLDYFFADQFANDAVSTVASIGGDQFPEFYVATLEVDAFYGGIDVQLTPFIRAALGARFEDSIQAVDTRVIGASLDGNFVEGVIDEEEFLPAATLTWNPIDDLQVRFGYSETVTRPQFRELAPTQFVDSDTDITFEGNPFLVNSALKNYDARAEYYFGRDQFLTFGIFYKDIENPIEEVIEPQGDGLVTRFLNAPSAELFGFEIEYEQILPLQEWLGWDFLGDKDVTIKTNYTWSDSEVGADGTVSFVDQSTLTGIIRSTTDDAINRIADGRQLQGQSEHLFNLQFGYTDDVAGSELNLLVNFASERIRSAGVIATGQPDVLEQPPLTVDVVYNKDVSLYGGDYTLSFNVENLFNDSYEAFQEGGGVTVDVDTYDVGTKVSFGVKRAF